ncbi:MAG: NAD(P)-dependent oxidoreductase [Lachnospiraceae bacterium]|nr:NAD(P)-dependent oxidoreductase [Lachnospiraceae bacterium]
MKKIAQSDIIPWDNLDGRSILITGATGLIGTAITNALLSVREERNLNIIIYAIVRDEEKARKIFGEQSERIGLNIIKHSDIQNPLKIQKTVHYIIHGANPTDSSFFVNNPVETAKTAFLGTVNILDFAYKKKIESMVFLSTMEVYGYPEKGHKVLESEIGSFSPTKVRNCYPISKQMCENLCYSYFAEYTVPIKILRLTQTLGVGVNYNDKRVFAEFARCAIEKRDIVLKTKGLTERSYLDISDAVTAILLVLLKGKNGEAYTVANEDTYCSIYEMAKLVADKYGIKVRIEEEDTTKFGYADTLYMDLDTTKLKKLGWYPQYSIIETYQKMIEQMDDKEFK